MKETNNFSFSEILLIIFSILLIPLLFFEMLAITVGIISSIIAIFNFIKYFILATGKSKNEKAMQSTLKKIIIFSIITVNTFTGFLLILVQCFGYLNLTIIPFNLLTMVETLIYFIQIKKMLKNLDTAGLKPLSYIFISFVIVILISTLFFTASVAFYSPHDHIVIQS